MKPALISYHGGHSGQYCNHAKDNLEDIVRRYIELGFPSVGISEHIPPISDAFLFPDEKEAGLSARDISRQFTAYMAEMTELKKKYAGQITLYRGMETETVTGSTGYVRALVDRFRPDYIVGSVHHVNDVCFDYSQDGYDRLARSLGGYDALYERYFDLQHEMIKELRPFVVGHFDLIRIYDDDYLERMQKPSIARKTDRNLELIHKLGLVLDFNLRPLSKGKKEPYLMGTVLEKARQLGIQVVPGDDSHCVMEAGANVARAIDILTRTGFDTHWPEPQLFVPPPEKGSLPQMEGPQK